MSGCRQPVRYNQAAYPEQTSLNGPHGLAVARTGPPWVRELSWLSRLFAERGLSTSGMQATILEWSRSDDSSFRWSAGGSSELFFLIVGSRAPSDRGLAALSHV